MMERDWGVENGVAFAARKQPGMHEKPTWKHCGKYGHEENHCYEIMRYHQAGVATNEAVEAAKDKLVVVEGPVAEDVGMQWPTLQWSGQKLLMTVVAQWQARSKFPFPGWPSNRFNVP